MLIVLEWASDLAIKSLASLLAPRVTFLGVEDEVDPEHDASFDYHPGLLGSLLQLGAR